VEVLIDEPIGEIAPEIHGHFVEHLGGVIYDGIWVGENSKIANLGGIRKDLIDHMQQLKAPVVRWPGGCFADSYTGATALGRATNAPPAPISGATSRRFGVPRAAPSSTNLTPSVPQSSCASAGCAAQSPTSRQTCVA
jgi:hypothetical protein